MAAVDHFLAMGGYARFVWPAYAVALIVMGGLLIESVLTYRKRRRALDAAEKRRR
ncbi:MAG TPA: heme exporter protein CcmD [Stellaceae bacterium]|nr:heme exporter protein CcmD [Stellaceae bacterium]